MLEFALRRLTMEPVGVVAASRPPGPGLVPLSLERAFGGWPLRTVAVGPMPVGELHRLVHARLGTWLPRPVLRRVPAGRDRDRIRRTLDLAQYLFEAGDTIGARSELEALAAEMAPGPDRARVFLRLAVVRYWAESQPAGAACARQPAAEAAPGSLTLAEAHALVAQLSHHSNLEREAHARQAIDLLAQQAHPDPRILSAALVGLAMARHYTGQGLSRDVLARAIELKEGLQAANGWMREHSAGPTHRRVSERGPITLS